MESLPGELTRQFDQKGFCLTSKIEAVILNSCIGQACQIPDEVSTLYSKDLNLERLQVQLSMLPDLVKSNALYSYSLKSVTSIRTICDIFNESLVIKNMFSEVHSLLQLYMTIPVTSATAERTFSVLRCMKTCLHLWGKWYQFRRDTWNSHTVIRNCTSLIRGWPFLMTRHHMMA